MKKHILITCLAIVTICASASAALAVPVKLNYQGYLTDSGGTPVNGTTNITFNLYAAVNLISPTWSETMAVNVVSGVYSVVLGATPANPISPSLFAGEPALGIAVESDPEMTPRRKLTSVAFSIRAASAEKADTVADGGVTNAMISGPIAASKIEQGPGSGLNADSVDGMQAADFVLKSGDTMSGALNLPADGLSSGSDQLILSGGKVGIGTAAPTAKLDVFTAPISTYGNWLPYSPQTPCEHCSDTCDGNHEAEYTCIAGQTRICEDIRNDTGEDWEYRSVSCNQAQTAAKITGDVRVTGGALTGNGAGLTNVNADLLDGQHSSEIIAAATDGIPPSWHQIIPAAQRFVLVMNNEAVLDKETGLVWEKVPAGVPGTWSAMNISCNAQTVGGRKSWHLPTLEQLASLVDPSNYNPALPTGHPFTLYTGVNDYYWTKTTVDNVSSAAMAVEFYTGQIYGQTKTSLGYALCVRGGQSYNAY